MKRLTIITGDTIGLINTQRNVVSNEWGVYYYPENYRSGEEIVAFVRNKFGNGVEEQEVRTLSLFVLREFDIQCRDYPDTLVTWVNVTREKTHTADDSSGTGTVACLDAALEQSDRYMRAEEEAAR